MLQNNHWLSDGEYKEVILRSILRRHCPDSVIVGRGFIVTQSGLSTQVDVLIVDASKPILFRDADLMIVTPDSVLAVVEVKTKLESKADIFEATQKLADIGKLCRGERESKRIWTGLFVYDSDRMNDTNWLEAIRNAYNQTYYEINCIADGNRCFIRYWNESETTGPARTLGSIGSIGRLAP